MAPSVRGRGRSAPFGGMIAMHAMPPTEHDGHRIQQGHGSRWPGGCSSPSLSAAQKSIPADKAPASGRWACCKAAARLWTASTHARRPVIKTRVTLLGLGASLAMQPRELGTWAKSRKTTESPSEYSPLLPNRHRRASASAPDSHAADISQCLTERYILLVVHQLTRHDRDTSRDLHDGNPLAPWPGNIGNIIARIGLRRASRSGWC